MLAATAIPVKFDATSTPEQRACVMAIDRSLTIFWTLVERLQAAADQRGPIHQVEEAIFRQLLAMGLSLLQAFVALTGDGDVGPTLTVPGDHPSDPPQVLPRLDTLRSRPDLSIFGGRPSRGFATATTGWKPPPSTPNCTCPGANSRTCSSSGWGPS